MGLLVDDFSVVIVFIRCWTHFATESSHDDFISKARAVFRVQEEVRLLTTIPSRRACAVDRNTCKDEEEEEELTSDDSKTLAMLTARAEGVVDNDTFDDSRGRSRCKTWSAL